LLIQTEHATQWTQISQYPTTQWVTARVTLIPMTAFNSVGIETLSISTPTTLSATPKAGSPSTDLSVGFVVGVGVASGVGLVAVLAFGYKVLAERGKSQDHSYRPHSITTKTDARSPMQFAYEMSNDRRRSSVGETWIMTRVDDAADVAISTRMAPSLQT
jgi:hypothetical protein